jgi:CPA2 family monovalent cation:H+ antiporter-2
VEQFDILKDLVVIIALAVLVVLVLRRVGLPSLVGFIIAGVTVGPRSIGLISNTHEVETLAEVGVVLLLFGVGLELPLERLRRLWKPILLGGVLQVGITVAAAAVLGSLFGLSTRTALFLGCLTAISSTAIVLRALETRGEIDAPHGRLTLGILVFQDLCVVPMMLAIPILAGQQAAGWGPILALLRALAILAGVVLAARLVVPRILHFIAETRQRDLFVLSLFLVCIGTAWVTSLAGVSLALGAFLAGLVVASGAFRHQAMADLVPFRELLASVFFVSVGMLLDPWAVVTNAGPIMLLLAFIVIGKTLIVLLVGTALRLPARVSILSGLALAQIGEFSFVLVHSARGTGLLDPTISGHLHAATVISMLITPLALLAGPHVVAGAGRLPMLTRLLGVKTARDAEAQAKRWRDHVIIGGYGVTGQELAEVLRSSGITHVVLDLNPENVRLATSQGSPAFFGDMTSVEILEHLGIHHAREMVVVINDPQAAQRAVLAARRAAPDLHIVVRARYLEDVQPFCEAGASRVVPEEIAAAVEVVVHVLQRHGMDKLLIENVAQRVRERDLQHHLKSACAAG